LFYGTAPPTMLRSKGMKRILLISAALADRVRLPKAFENALSADGWTRVLADNMQRSLFAGVIPEDLVSENVGLTM
jgi:hypothetical protein